MKAYKAFNEFTGYGTVVFAENTGQAKCILLGTWEFEGFDYIELRVRRAPELDSEYRGHSEMDWEDDLDRLALVKNGWSCHDDCFDPDDCERCTGRDYCDRYEEYLEEADE